MADLPSEGGRKDGREQQHEQLVPEAAGGEFGSAPLCLQEMLPEFGFLPGLCPLSSLCVPRSFLVPHAEGAAWAS